MFTNAYMNGNAPWLQINCHRTMFTSFRQGFGIRQMPKQCLNQWCFSVIMHICITRHPSALVHPVDLITPIYYWRLTLWSETYDKHDKYLRWNVIQFHYNRWWGCLLWVETLKPRDKPLCYHWTRPFCISPLSTDWVSWGLWISASQLWFPMQSIWWTSWIL